MSISKNYINIDNISKHFGDVVAVDEVSLQIDEGEFFSLLGASGCGKTTLLRMLAGLEAPTSGEIYIDGKPMSEVPPFQRPTNMVFQNYAIFPHLDIRANIAYGLRKQKLPRAEVDHLVEEALEMVKLSGFGKRRANELSGGQRQRIALARALIMRPKVLLLDEPLGALDKKLREEMQLELRTLQESVGITFIFVTHDQEEAMTLSDRVAVMARGDVLQIASPKALYSRPNSVEVAEFIGQMNFIEAKTVQVKNESVLLNAAGLGEIQVMTDANFVKPGAQVIVAIRPEKLSISSEPFLNDADSVQGKLITTAYLGDRSHYYVDVEGCLKPLSVVDIEHSDSYGKPLERGADVWLSWKKEAPILLPAG